MSDLRALAKAWAGFRQRHRLRPGPEARIQVSAADLESRIREGLQAIYPWFVGPRFRFPEELSWYLDVAGRRSWRRGPDTRLYAVDELETLLRRSEGELRWCASDPEQTGIAMFRVGFGERGGVRWFVLCDADDRAFGRVEAWARAPWDPGQWCQRGWLDLPTFLQQA